MNHITIKVTAAEYCYQGEVYTSGVLPVSMADGSLLIRLRSIVTLSTSPECLATVKVNRMPLFRRTYTKWEGGIGGRKREREEERKRGGGREKGK